MSSNEDKSPAALMRRAAKEERRLLREEQDAERDLLEATQNLADTEGRLRQAQKRVDRRRAAVVAAVATLAERQLARATGPALAIIAVEPSPILPAPSTTPERDDSEPSPVSAAESDDADAPAKPKRRPAPRRRPTVTAE